jgi:hypothetical protein
VPVDHVHDAEVGHNAVEEWFAVESMERALGFHNRHTGKTDSANPIVTTALVHAGWVSGGSQWPGGLGEAERALRGAIRLRQQWARR